MTNKTLHNFQNEILNDFEADMEFQFDAFLEKDQEFGVETERTLAELEGFHND